MADQVTANVFLYKIAKNYLNLRQFQNLILAKVIQTFVILQIDPKVHSIKDLIQLFQVQHRVSVETQYTIKNTKM